MFSYRRVRGFHVKPVWQHDRLPTPRIEPKRPTVSQLPQTVANGNVGDTSPLLPLLGPGWRAFARYAPRAGQSADSALKLGRLMLAIISDWLTVADPHRVPPADCRWIRGRDHTTDA